MSKDTQITALTQGKISQYAKKVSKGLSCPEQKFVHDMLYGILKTGMPQLGSIGRSLGESISVKKRTERLSRHLRKDGLGSALMANHLETHRVRLGRCKYLLVDLTDLSKRYGTRHEGQAGVHDGSAKQKGYGYPLVTVVGVGNDRSEVVPLYSELYSMKQESTSENLKLLAAIDAIAAKAPKGAAFVLDRGCDRSRLFEHFQEHKIPFIVRMNSKRHLQVNGQAEAVWKIAKYTKLPFHMQMLRQGKNQKKTVHIICGAKRVKLTKDGEDLWLVSAKYKSRNGGRFYFLTNLDCETEEMLLARVLKGYHSRWIIEEVHREIKEDLHLESIRLYGYASIKNMAALLWIAASFYYTKLAGLESLDILLDMARSVVYRLKLREITGFVYYKLFYLVNSLLKSTKRIRRTRFNITSQPQLALF
jgi:hypothetical protein